MKHSALVLLSGGVDSAVLLHYVVKRLNYSKVQAIIFDYGQSNRIEISYAREIANELGVSYEVVKIPLNQIGGSSLIGQGGFSIVVPGRNSIFLSVASAYAEVRDLKDVFFGPTKEDFRDFLDCRFEYVSLISQALRIGSHIQGIYAPFVNKTKKEVYLLGKQLKVPFELTWSCYFPTKDNEPCGKCNACLERSRLL